MNQGKEINLHMTIAIKLTGKHIEEFGYCCCKNLSPCSMQSGGESCWQAVETRSHLFQVRSTVLKNTAFSKTTSEFGFEWLVRHS